MKYINFFIALFCFGLTISLHAQVINSDVGVSGSFEPSTIEINQVSNLRVSIQKNFFTTIPDSTILVIISFPAGMEYVYNGDPIFGPDAAEYVYEYNAVDNSLIVRNAFNTSGPFPDEIFVPVVGQSLTSSPTQTNLLAALDPTHCGNCNDSNINNDNATPSMVVPVEYDYIKADKLSCEAVQLSWATSQEVNNKGFQIIRSTDRRNWEVIDWVDGQGNSNRTNTYAYTDKTIDPSVYTYFYQLVQVDLDEMKSKSEMVSAQIDCAESYTTTVFPNPTVNILNYTLGEQYLDENLQITIFNMEGQLVHNLLIPDNGSLNGKLDLDNLPPGKYSVRFDNKQTSENLSFIKIR